MAFTSTNGVGVWRPEITPEVLEAAGYRRFRKNVLQDHRPTYMESFQKRFADEVGTRYFITFVQHHFHWPDGGDQITMECDAQFERDGVTFEIESVQSFDARLDQVETFFADVWERLGCKHYERGFD